VLLARRWRSCHRTLRVARTSADIKGSESIHATHVAEALQLNVRLIERWIRSPEH
jgi:predicted ATPase with chaperone activity